MDMLELRVSEKVRLVVSRMREDVLLEVETPTTTSEGHNWGVLTQLRLTTAQVMALVAYLTESNGHGPPSGGGTQAAGSLSEGIRSPHRGGVAREK